MPNNVFEGLDELLAGQARAERQAEDDTQSILRELDDLKRRIDKAKGGAPQRQLTLKEFLADARQSWLWCGAADAFGKEKTRALLFGGLVLFLGLFSTLLNCAAIGFYSTFSLFENIWLLDTVFAMCHMVRMRRLHEVNDLSRHWWRRVSYDANGFLIHGRMKKRYKVFLVLSIISGFFNIVDCFAENVRGTSFNVAATVIELLFIVACVVFIRFADDFTFGYGFTRLDGQDLSGNSVTLFYTPIENKLYRERDFYQQYPLLEEKES